MNFHDKNFNSNTPQLIPLLQKTKDLYLLWYKYFQILPKPHRYTLGQKVDNLLLALIESLATASFLPPIEKQPYVKLAIRKTDTLKIFLMILWEIKSIDNKKYILLSEHTSQIGRMLGGWNGQLSKQNSPNKK